MSAWYVLSAMGFYSVTPGYSYYVIGTPTFESAQIHLENGKTFTIRANNLSKENIYIQRATLGEEEYSYTTISHEAIMHGDELVLEMGDKPSEWGQSFRPPLKSSENLLVPTPYFTTGINTFKDTLSVGVGSLCADCSIFMAIPHKNSLVYSRFIYRQNVTIGADQKIGAFALTADGRSSDTIWANFYKLDEKIKLTLRSKYANQYSAGGDNALIDKQHGTANFRTGAWQGYQGQDFEAVLDLGDVRESGEISIGFLQDIKSWIWYPQKVEVYVYESDDEITLYEFDLSEFEKQEGAMVHRINFKHNDTIEKIKIIAKSIGPCPDWHLGAGGKSWIFIDEIEIK